MTYRNLKQQLDSLNKTQLDQDVTVLCMNSDETIPVMDLVADWTVERGEQGVDQVKGVLDQGHPYLTIAF